MFRLPLSLGVNSIDAEPMAAGSIGQVQNVPVINEKARVMNFFKMANRRPKINHAGIINVIDSERVSDDGHPDDRFLSNDRVDRHNIIKCKCFLNDGLHDRLYCISMHCKEIVIVFVDSTLYPPFRKGPR